MLAIAGISSMGIVKGLIGSNARILSTLVVILSVALLAKGSKFGSIAVPTADIGIIFLYSSVTLILALFSRIPLMQNGYGFIYQAANFMQILLLWNFDLENDMDYYVELGAWFCGVFCIITLGLVLKNSGGSLFVNSIESEEGEFLFNRSTIGSIGFKSFVMALAYKPESRTKIRMRLIFLFFSIAVIVASTRRGVYLAAIASCLLHFRNCRTAYNYIDMDKALKKVILSVVCVVIFLVIYSKSTFLQDVLGRAGESLVNGIRTFLGLEDSDMAASMRVSTSSRVIEQYLHNSTPMQTLLGRGYMTTWVDMPFIQAFWDLGLVGGIAFGVIQFIIPLKYLLKKTESQGMRAAQYFTIMSIVEGIASGYPYGRFFNSVLMITIDTAREQNSYNQQKAGRNI